MSAKLKPVDQIYIIDGSSWLYRAFYALQPMYTSHGVQVQAVFGFCRMLKKLIDQYRPEYLLLVWDSRGVTERQELYSEYKSTRAARPSELSQQKAKIQEFADLIGLAQIARAGIEADDIIASLAQDYSQAGHKVVVVSSDKDLYQLVVDANITVLDPFKQIAIDQTKFQELYQFPAQKLAFFYALVGDASDNIPGAKGIGKQTAQQLVQQFASLDELYQNLAQVAAERTRTALATYRADAELSLELFKLKYYSFQLPVAQTKFISANWAKARNFFAELEFNSLLKDLPLSTGVTTAITSATGGVTQGTIGSELGVDLATRKNYQFVTITTVSQLQALCQQLTQCTVFAIDTETTGLNPWRDQLVGISLCLTPGMAYYIPVGHQTGEAQLDRDLVLTSLRVYLEDSKYQKYLHHAKFDQLVLWSAGINLAGVVFDTMLAASLVLTEKRRLGLKYLSEHYLGDQMLTYEQVVTARGYTDFAQVPLALATSYAAADAHQVLLLQSILAELLQAQQLSMILTEIELPISQLLFEMERAGIALDQAVLAQLDLLVAQKLAQIKTKLQALVELAPDFNFNATRQVAELLFQKLQLPAPKKSGKTGAYSTDQAVLSGLARIHPVPNLILQYRELTKLKNTYIDKLPLAVEPKTGKIHTNFSQTATATGRLASSEPNLQNIPADSELGLQVRAAFKPDPGNLFLSADYSQIELRVLAHFSGDQNLLQAFRAGLDIHTQTAAKIFAVAPAVVTKEQRQVGKRINFSILYGLTPFGLAKDLGISPTAAKQYIAAYFAQYPGVLTWMERVVAETKQLGYVTTWQGRRRVIPEIHEANQNLYKLGCRLAINTKAQGTAAEIVKLGMLAVQAQLKQAGLGAQILLQIHDELLLMVPETELVVTEKIVKQALEGVVQWQVPLEVTLKSGQSWAEVTK